MSSSKPDPASTSNRILILVQSKVADTSYRLDLRDLRPSDGFVMDFADAGCVVLPRSSRISNVEERRLFALFVQEKLLKRLAEIKNTPPRDRWPDAEWPTVQAFHDAEAFIRTLAHPITTAVSLGAADDGEINFLWKGDGIHVDLGFYGTGEYSCYARGKNGNEFYPCGSASKGLTPELVDLLVG